MTETEAVDVELKNQRWYEELLIFAVTPPAVTEDMRHIVDPHGLPAHLVHHTGLEVDGVLPGTLLPPPVQSLERDLDIQSQLQPNEGIPANQEGSEELSKDDEVSDLWYHNVDIDEELVSRSLI